MKIKIRAYWGFKNEALHIVYFWYPDVGLMSCICCRIDKEKLKNVPYTYKSAVIRLSLSAPISTKWLQSWAASTTKISRPEVKWQVFRSSRGFPGVYLATPGCTLMTTGCFLRYFNSRCSWHQEHHTQKQEVKMSLQKEPCTEHFSLKCNNELK